MIYPIKTLSQLPLILKGFRKEKSLTQAAMAEKLGITQQSYAYFEANPAAATLERLYMVLRMLDVQITLDQTSPSTYKSTVVTEKENPSANIKVGRIATPTRKKERW